MHTLLRGIHYLLPSSISRKNSVFYSVARWSSKIVLFDLKEGCTHMVSGCVRVHALYVNKFFGSDKTGGVVTETTSILKVSF